MGLLFGRFSLCAPYAKSAKMADLGGLARFSITQLCGQFWGRRLRRNVVRCLHFKRIFSYRSSSAIEHYAVDEDFNLLFDYICIYTLFK